MICRNSGPGKSNAQLNNLQGPYQEGQPAKRGRGNYHHASRGGYQNASYEQQGSGGYQPGWQ